MKVKNWAWDCAEKEFGSVTGFVESGDLDKETAVIHLKNKKLIVPKNEFGLYELREVA